MSIETCGLLDLLNSVVSSRVYPDVLPHGLTRPAIAYRRVVTTPIQSLSGDIWGSDITAELVLGAPTREAVRALALSVRQAIYDDTTIVAEVAGDTEEFDEETRLHLVLVELRLYERSEVTE